MHACCVVDQRSAKRVCGGSRTKKVHLEGSYKVSAVAKLHYSCVYPSGVSKPPPSLAPPVHPFKTYRALAPAERNMKNPGTTQPPSNALLRFWWYLSFAWVLAPIAAIRQKVTLNPENLYYPNDCQADHVIEDFDARWTALLKSGKAQKRPLLTVLQGLYGRYYVLGGIFKLLWSTFIICGAPLPPSSMCLS